MAERVPTTTRRGFLGHAAGATFAGGAAFASSPAVADPLLDLLGELRSVQTALAQAHGAAGAVAALTERERLLLRSIERCPPPTTREGALAAIRLARDNEEEDDGNKDTIGLLSAALAFLEAPS
jgi:hypothetical protein